MTRTSSRPCRIPSAAALAAGLLLAGLTPLAAVDRRAYVANYGDGTLTVLDISATPPVPIATIPVGEGPAAIAVDRYGEKVLVTNAIDGTLMIVDARTTPPVVVDTVDVGELPIGVAIHPDGTKAYVVNAESANLSVIDLTLEPPAVVRTRPIGAEPEGIVIHPSGDRLYITDNFDGQGDEPSAVWQVDLTVDPPNANLAFRVGPEAHGIAISEDGDRLYVVSLEDRRLRVVDTTVQPHAVIDSILIGNEPFLVAVDGERAVVSREVGRVVPVDVGTVPGTVLGLAFVADVPRGLAIARGSGLVYAVSFVGGVLEVLDPAQGHQVVATVDLGTNPAAIGDFLAPSPGFLFADGFESGDGSAWSTSAPLAALFRRASVADVAAGTLSVLDLAPAEPTLSATVPVGAGPVAAAVDRFGERVLVSNLDDSTVSILDARATPPAVVAAVEVGPGPVGLAIVPDGSRAFVVNAADATLSVIDLTVSPPFISREYAALRVVDTGNEPHVVVGTIAVDDSGRGAGR